MHHSCVWTGWCSLPELAGSVLRGNFSPFIHSSFIRSGETISITLHIIQRFSHGLRYQDSVAATRAHWKWKICKSNEEKSTVPFKRKCNGIKVIKICYRKSVPLFSCLIFIWRMGQGMSGLQNGLCDDCLSTAVVLRGAASSLLHTPQFKLKKLMIEMRIMKKGNTKADNDDGMNDGRGVAIILKALSLDTNLFLCVFSAMLHLQHHCCMFVHGCAHSSPSPSRSSQLRQVIVAIAAATISPTFYSSSAIFEKREFGIYERPANRVRNISMEFVYR